jgi:hypothetical protein
VQKVLLSAQGMSVTKIAEVTFTSTDRVRDVVHSFNAEPLFRASNTSQRPLPKGRDGR